MGVVSKRRTSKNIGTAYVRIGGYTAPAATEVAIVGLSIANLKTVPVACNVAFSNSTANTMIAVNVPIPPGAVFVPAGKDQKIILQTGDGILVSCNTAAGVDALMSFVERS